MLGQNWPASETPSKWLFAEGPIIGRSPDKRFWIRRCSRITELNTYTPLQISCKTRPLAKRHFNGVSLEGQ